MTVRLQGWTKDEEMRTSTEATEERQVGRRTSEPCSETNGIEEMKLGDVTDLKKREIEIASTRTDEKIESASKRSNKRMEKVIQAHQANTMEQMDDVAISRCSTPRNERRNGKNEGRWRRQVRENKREDLHNGKKTDKV